jgi:hypothetical protein
MNCDCLDFNEKKLAKHYAKQGVINPKVSADFLGINFATGEGVISLTYTVRGDNRPYNSAKGKPVSMIASFCPWCGKSTKRASADQGGNDGSAK